MIELLLGKLIISLSVAQAAQMLPPLAIEAAKLISLLRHQVELLLHAWIIERAEALELRVELIKSLALPRIGKGAFHGRTKIAIEPALELLHVLRALLRSKTVPQPCGLLIKAVQRLLVGAVELVELVAIHPELLSDGRIGENWPLVDAAEFEVRPRGGANLLLALLLAPYVGAGTAANLSCRSGGTCGPRRTLGAYRAGSTC